MRLALPRAHAFSRARERRLESLVAEGLQQVVEGSHFESLQGVGIVGGDEDDDRPPVGLDSSRSSKPSMTGHLHVEEQEVRRLARDGLERFRSRRRNAPANLDVRLPLEKLQEAPSRRRLVVDDERADLIHAPAREW